MDTITHFCEQRNGLTSEDVSHGTAWWHILVLLLTVARITKLFAVLLPLLVPNAKDLVYSHL